MLDIIIQAFWLLLPAGFANMAPVLFNRLNFLNYPVDFNILLNKKPLLGKHKTYRGLFFGIILSIIVVYIQKLAYPAMKSYSLFDYSSANILLVGFLFGFGALFGDMLKSFFKRRININPGKAWTPFDQIDWIIGSLIFINFYIRIPLEIIIFALIIFSLLHPAINYIGYALKLKKNKF